MQETRSKIIQLANDLIRSVGYNAFSYADISKQLEIKNAAIHYYFPKKGDLGLEIIRHNLDAFEDLKEKWYKLSYKQQYRKFITMHSSFVGKNWTCVVGSLSPAFDTLTPEMQKELQKLIMTIVTWLSNVLEKGRATNELHFDQDPETMAYMIHSSLLSSLQINKVLHNKAYSRIQNGLLSL